MAVLFSGIHRDRILQEIAAQEWDLLVIGGGITGAGVALDAQSRGIKTALVEMQDFAAGTSSRSTKLIHGGLRYLKQLEIGLVREVGQERAIVYENAPHVTRPEWMLLPIVKGGTYGKWATSLGLLIYDYLAKVKRSERRRMLSVDETLMKEPLLRKEGLLGAGFYVEYRTDDARLTMEVLKAAVSRGTKAVNYAQAQNFIYQNDRLVGAQVVDLFSGQTHPIYAKKIVNATGPWVDELRERDGSKQGKTLRWTKGVHLVVDHRRFPLAQPIYFDTPDGRMVFAIPREEKTYIGTTDTDYKDDLREPVVTKEDRDYLLEAVHGMFPTLSLLADDVESSWAGIRPLIHEEGKAPSEISRKDEIFHSSTGLLTIAGGKLTGYRRMAQKVTDQVAKQLNREWGRQIGLSVTERIPLSGGDFGGSNYFPSFVQEKAREGIALGLSEGEAVQLASRYGTNLHHLYTIIKERGHEAEKYDLPLGLFASLVYAVEQEMAVTPCDYFIRRTSSLHFDIAWVRKWKEPVTLFMQAVFGWDAETTATHRSNLEERLKKAEAVEAVI